MQRQALCPRFKQALAFEPRRKEFQTLLSNLKESGEA
jgi:hypothetical protein